MPERKKDVRKNMKNNKKQGWKKKCIDGKTTKNCAMKIRQTKISPNMHCRIVCLWGWVLVELASQKAFNSTEQIHT